MSSKAVNFTDLVASLTKHSEVLNAAASVEIPGTAVETDTPVREMLQRAGELVRGAAALGEQRNPRALGVLSRVVLENLILLLWVQVHEENVTKLNQEALSELARVARVNFEKGKARVMNRETRKDVTSEFLQSDRFKGLKKPPSIETRAKEAGVEDLYTVFYRFMSLELHGRGLTPKGESPESVSAVQMQGIGALALASGHAGVKWLIHRERTDNETLRQLLGIGRPSPNKSFQPTASGGG